MKSPLDARPVVVAVAGPNGAGKTTFCESHLLPAGLRLVNADDLARELAIGPYEAAEVASRLRETLLEQGESFVFETVFSDPVGEKVAFLKRAVARGYAVVLCFVGVDGPEVSEERVAMRVLQGGHDVPSAKLAERFPRTLRNLGRAIRELPYVQVFDNGDLARPFRKVAVYRGGKEIEVATPRPRWLVRALATGPRRPAR
ncbi:MAG TPA: zeta toxin family protein [Anaeromyxobacteraceae bacterium]|nr:zeta toxin family protein [Anaeromyxobacteraceae bacterium]